MRKMTTLELTEKMLHIWRHEKRSIATAWVRANCDKPLIILDVLQRSGICEGDDSYEARRKFVQTLRGTI